MAHPAWDNPDVIDELKRLWALPETTARQIAIILSQMSECNLGRDSIIGKANRMKLGAKPSHPGPRGRITLPNLTDGRVKKNILKTEKPHQSKAVECAPVKQEAEPPVSITIENIGHNMCRWPIGDPQSTDFHFCGEHTSAGKSYCSEHAARAFVSLKHYARKPKPEPLIID